MGDGLVAKNWCVLCSKFHRADERCPCDNHDFKAEIEYLRHRSEMHDQAIDALSAALAKVQQHPAMNKDRIIQALEEEVAALKGALHSAVNALLEVGGGNERTG